MKTKLFKILVVGVAIVSLVAPSFTQGAIAVDATSDQGGASGTTTATWAHTVGVTANPILWVAAWNNSAGGARTFSSASYNGTAMTSIGSDFSGGAGGYSELFYLLNPATGTHTISVTQSASGYFGGFAASYTGVKQVAPTGVATDHTQTTNPNQFPLTTTDNNSWTIAMVENNIGGTTTAGTSTVGRIQNQVTQNGGIFDSGAPITPAGTQNIKVTSTGATFVWVDIGAVMAPAVTVATSTRKIRGVGISR